MDTFFLIFLASVLTMFVLLAWLWSYELGIVERFRRKRHTDFGGVIYAELMDATMSASQESPKEALKGGRPSYNFHCKNCRVGYNHLADGRKAIQIRLDLNNFQFTYRNGQTVTTIRTHDVALALSDDDFIRIRAYCERKRVEYEEEKERAYAECQKDLRDYAESAAETFLRERLQD